MVDRDGLSRAPCISGAGSCASSGLGRVDFAMGPTAADEPADGLVIIEFKLDVSTAERADFVGAKTGVVRR